MLEFAGDFDVEKVTRASVDHFPVILTLPLLGYSS